MRCILSFKCDVYNLGPLDDSFRRSCQILRYDLKSYIVKRQKGWSFRARKVACFNFGLNFENHRRRETSWTTFPQISEG